MRGNSICLLGERDGREAEPTEAEPIARARRRRRRRSLRKVYRSLTFPMRPLSILCTNAWLFQRASDSLLSDPNVRSLNPDIRIHTGLWEIWRDEATDSSSCLHRTRDFLFEITNTTALCA